MPGPEKFYSVFARNCEVRRIPKEVAAPFLDSCHLFGDCSAKFRYGIYVRRYSGAEGRLASGDMSGARTDGDHDMSGNAAHPYPVGTLVAVASFSNARRWLKGGQEVRSYEWLRYASLPEVRVLGGMGLVLKTFIDEVGPDDIMTYVPDSYEGGVYETLGFVREGVKIFTKPSGETSSSVKFRLKLKDY